ncbi:MAG: sugar phosphate nucleotidyltransferase [Candidatus Shapirobacteria bacterium]|nr:sugar phosphate nucleotidyltransferase [Candidatus Shapirobacteria bacterium]
MSHERLLDNRSENLGISGITAYVVAGGRGLRMESLTHDLIPKSLVNIGNSKVLLDFVFDTVSKVGINDIVVCLSHHSEKIIERYRGMDGMNINFSIDDIPNGGIVKALESALKKFPQNKDFVFLHGDEVVTNFSLLEMFNFHKSNDGMVTGLLSKNLQASRTVVMKLENDYHVSDFIRNDDGSHYDYLSSLGLFIFKPSIYNEISRFKTWEDMMKTLSSENKVYGFSSDAFFFNINTPENLKDFVNFSIRSNIVDF